MFFSIRFWCREWRQKNLTACDLNLYCRLYLYLNIYVEPREKLRTNLITYLIPFTKIIKPKQQRHFQQTRKNNSKNEENEETQTKTYQDTLLLALRRQRRRQLKLEVVDVHRWVSQPKKVASI